MWKKGELSGLMIEEEWRKGREREWIAIWMGLSDQSTFPSTGPEGHMKEDHLWCSAEGSNES